MKNGTEIEISNPKEKNNRADKSANKIKSNQLFLSEWSFQFKIVLGFKTELRRLSGVAANKKNARQFKWKYNTEVQMDKCLRRNLKNNSECMSINKTPRKRGKVMLKSIINIFKVRKIISHQIKKTIRRRKKEENQYNNNTNNSSPHFFFSKTSNQIFSQYFSIIQNQRQDRHLYQLFDMGNCTNKQDSPRSLATRDINNKAFFGKEFNKNEKGSEKNRSHKQSVISTTENSSSNPVTTSSSFINLHQEGYSKNQNKYQIYANLEQIEELESSNYLQSEMRTLQDETKGLSHRLINPISIPQQNLNTENCIKIDNSISQQSTTVTRGSGMSNSSQSNIHHNSSQSNSPSRMQRSNGSYSISPRTKEKKKTAYEVRNIIRMQTESFYQNLISTELNDILKQGESMTTVMSYFQFSNNDQVLDLVKDLYNSIINKKNKLSEIVLPEHRDIVMQFIQQAYLILDRGIQQLLKTQKKLINMTDSNSSQITRQPNPELSLNALEVLVETYQIIQYFQQLASTFTYIPQNKWWTKNQNEKDLSSFFKKFVRLSQQLNAEFQDGYSLTPGIPKRQRKEKKHTTAATFSYNIEGPTNRSIEIEAEKCKEDEDLQSSFEQNKRSSPHCKSYSNSEKENSQSEKQKIYSPNKKNPTNFLPLISLSNNHDISKDEIVEQDENEEEKYQNRSGSFSNQKELENVQSLNESDYPCKTHVYNLQELNNANKIIQKQKYFK